jgi:hypothetical protein
VRLYREQEQVAVWARKIAGARCRARLRTLFYLSGMPHRTVTCAPSNCRRPRTCAALSGMRKRAALDALKRGADKATERHRKSGPKAPGNGGMESGCAPCSVGCPGASAAPKRCTGSICAAMYLLPGHPRAFAYNPRPNRTIPPRSFSRARAPFFQYICPQLAVEVSQITHCLLLWLAKPALDPCRYHRACFRGTYKFS